MVNSETQLKRTALYNEHLSLNAKMVPFAGWEMPVLYQGPNGGVINEHLATRNSCGLFDVSHMGEIEFSGPESLKALNYLTCNDVSKLVDGRAHYNAITNHTGGLVDDIIIYRKSHDRFFVCVNASNVQADFEWFCKHNTFDTQIQNLSDQYGQIALQGPKALELTSKLIGSNKASDIKYFGFFEVDLFGQRCLIARTGYSGEDGVEIFCPVAISDRIWRQALELGAQPCGLGARDSLRLEAAMPLYGHELGMEISAIESGLSWIIKFDKGDFVGREALLAQHGGKNPRSLVGFNVEGAGILREQTVLLSGSGEQVGYVTSGTLTPYLKRALGMALVDSRFAALGTKLKAEIRGREIECQVVKIPFYKRSK